MIDCKYCGSTNAMLRAFVAYRNDGVAADRGDPSDSELFWCKNCGSIHVEIYDNYGERTGSLGQASELYKTTHPSIIRRVQSAALERWFQFSSDQETRQIIAPEGNREIL